MKKALVIRCGALGDMIMITPVFRELKRQGYYVICHTGPRGLGVLKHNPNIDEFIEYEYESKDNPEASKQWDALKEKIKPDFFVNFTESIEVNVAIHPRSAEYTAPKWERAEKGGINYYEATEAWSGLKFESYKPELFFDKDELIEAEKHLKKDHINILWAMSGSGANKAYPWTEYVIGDVIKDYKNVHFITVGNVMCQLLEAVGDKNVTNLSGKISFRQTMALTKICDLVISPDTGTLHSAGCFDTYKIGILGHTTIENITKHFENDYSLEADTKLCECSPCYRLIYNHELQCPTDSLTGGAYCMSIGQPAIRLYKQIRKVLDVIRTNSVSATVSTLQKTK